jgi:hypothetical protein
LKKMLVAEVGAVLRQQPTLKVVKVADGAADNWDYIASDALPDGEQVVDFFHASEHLHAAIANVYGDSTRETRHRHEVLRDTLRDDVGGRGEGKGADPARAAVDRVAANVTRSTITTCA